MMISNLDSFIQICKQNSCCRILFEVIVHTISCRCMNLKMKLQTMIDKRSYNIHTYVDNNCVFFPKASPMLGFSFSLLEGGVERGLTGPWCGRDV